MQSYYHQNDNHPFIWYDEDYVNTCRSKLMNINYIELEDAFSFTKINKIPIVIYNDMNNVIAVFDDGDMITKKFDKYMNNPEFVNIRMNYLSKQNNEDMTHMPFLIEVLYFV